MKEKNSSVTDDHGALFVAKTKERHRRLFFCHENMKNNSFDRGPTIMEFNFTKTKE
jgi:hypothetical protein